MFLDALEPYVLCERLTVLGPEVLASYLEHCQDGGAGCVRYVSELHIYDIYICVCV